MRYAICLLFGLLALAGCGGQPDDYMRATVDGKSIVFGENAYAIISGLEGRMEVLTASGSVEGSNGAESFEIDLELPGGRLATTRYSAALLDKAEPRPGVRMGDSLTAQYSPNTTGSYIDDPGEHGAGDFVVEVTSLGKDRVQGRFAGDLELRGKVVHVTEGRFSLPYEYKPRNNPW